MCASFMAHIYFHIEDGFEQYDRRKWPYYVLGILIVVALGYGAAIFLAPKLPVFGNSIEATEKYYQDNHTDYVKINRINLIAPLTGGTQPQLDKNVWLKSTNTPKDAGPIEIVARSFQISLTPEATRQKSPFNLLSKLKEGDAIEVNYAGAVYGYRVKSIKQSAPEDADKQDNILLLYTVKSNGDADGAQSIVAEAINPIKNNQNNEKTPIL